MRGRSRPEPLPPTPAAPWAERPPSVLELERRFQLLTGMSSRLDKMMKEREERQEQGNSLEQARRRRLRCWSQSWNQELLERLKVKARAERETGKGKTSKGKGNIDEGTIGEGDDSAGKGEIGGKAVRPAKAKAQKEQRWPVPRGSVAVHSLKSGCRKIGKERLAAEDPKKAL